VVLLWWPAFFHTDSVTTWLVRGIVWTLAFELLLVALSPFELALWSTHRGVRISQRVEAKRALLDHDSPNRRIGRRAALALAALSLPLALIALGVGQHITVAHSAPPKVTRVTRVVRVVRPVKVERIVKVRTVRQTVPAEAVYQAPVAVNRAPAETTKHTATKRTTQKRTTTPVAPKAHVKLPASSGESTTQTSDSTPATEQTHSSAPSTTSGAAVQPTT
jgi:hypothetical protein